MIAYTWERMHAGAYRERERVFLLYTVYAITVQIISHIPERLVTHCYRHIVTVECMQEKYNKVQCVHGKQKQLCLIIHTLNSGVLFCKNIPVTGMQQQKHAHFAICTILVKSLYEIIETTFLSCSYRS